MSDHIRIFRRRAIRRYLTIAVSVGQIFSSAAWANPTNPVVVNGAASFNHAGKVLTVTNSNGAIINWDKFSIQAGETTRFVQPSASSAVLNRVLNDPSSIYGTLNSNGRVWLINPAGIMVGPGGRVDTAGFVASTLGVSNQDFLAGRKLFEGPPGAGNVLNQGEIRTPTGGTVYLVGANVGNEGIISTPKGETILAAGAKVSLIDSATPGVKVDITGAEGNATNLGEIAATAGRVGIAGVIVRNSGQVNASSVVSEGGRIFLKASRDTYVESDSRLSVTGTRGGKVEVLGERVAVTDGAVIDASGANGGGSILIGGDYQGKNSAIQNAKVTYFGKDATLKADATGAGDGGKVIVWANDTTRAYGGISARGGALGGNGGFVETSGKSHLDVNGIAVDTRAASGRAGTWLLDPTNIYIAVDQATATAAGMIGGDISVDSSGPLVFQTGGAPDDSLLQTGTLQSALASNSVVEVNTNNGSGVSAGHIFVKSPVTWGNSNTLKLNTTGTTGNINIDADIIATSGQLWLNSGSNIQKIGGSKIKVDKLQAVASLGVSLPGQNEVRTFAASASSGPVALDTQESSGLHIGTVNGTQGVSAYGPADIKQHVAGGITVDNNLSSTMAGVLLSVMSGTGGISQSGPITFAGNGTSLTTVGGPVVLNNPGNDFTGTVTVNTGSGLAQISDMNSLMLGPINATGGFSALAGGPLSTTAGAISAGAAQLDLTGSSLTFAASPGISGDIVNLNAMAANGQISIPVSTSISGTTVNIKTDQLDLTGTIAGTSSVNITRQTAGIEVQVGGSGSDSPGYLNVRQTEIDNIATPVYRFGDTASVGGLRVEGPLTIPPTKTLVLLTSNLGGSQIVQNPAAIVATDFLRAEGGSGVTLTAANNLIGNLSGKTLSGDFRVKNNSALNIANVGGLNGIDAGANDVWLEVLGTLNNSGGSSNIVASGLNVKASDNINLIGPNMVGKLAADLVAAGTGSMTFNNGQALDIDTVGGVPGIDSGSNARPIIISTTSGDLTVIEPIHTTASPSIHLSAAGKLILNNAITGSAAGSVTLQSLDPVGISGNAAGAIDVGNLEILSSGNVNLGNAMHNVTTLAGTAATGFSFVNGNNLSIGMVGATSGLIVTNGDITLTTAAKDKLLSIGNSVQATTGSVSYVTDGFSAAAMTTTSGNAGKFAEIKPYTVSTNIEFSPLADVAGTLRLNGTELNSFSTPLLKVGNVAQTNGILVDDMVSSGTFTTLSLITGGAITQNAGKTISIPNLNADGFAGVNLPEANNVANLAGHTNIGNFTFSSATGTNIAQVDINNGISVSTSGNISLTATAGGIGQGGAAILSTPAGTLTASAPAGIGLTVPTNNVSGLVTLTSGGPVAYTASGNIQLGAVSTPGTVNITSGTGSILDGNAASPNLSGSAIGLNAFTGIGSVGDPIEVDPTVGINALTAGGSIYLASAATLLVGSISAPATVSLQSTGGAITDANGASPNIVAGVASLFANSGIGSGDALETQLGGLTANNSTANTIEINNLGPLSIASITGATTTGGVVIKTVGSLTTTGAISSLGGPVSLTADGAALTVGAGGISASTGITLTAGGPTFPVAGKTGDDLTINGPLTLSPAAGTITLNAGNAIGGSNVPVTGGGTTVVSNPNLHAPTLATCIANPATAGCAAVLPPLATCIATPSTPGCEVVLPTLATCTTTPSTPGCNVVLPTLATCIATPTAPGCTVVLPTLATCIATPTAPGCTAVLPTVATCTATPTTPGCTVVLPTLATCIATPTTAGCTAVLPTVATCTATPATPGCSAVLPTVATCTATPSTPGCSVILPSLAACISAPSTPGCSAVLPSVATCTATPSTPGCSVVMPTLASCIANSFLPGCSAVLPSIASCTAVPTLPGCSVVLPSLASCVSEPSQQGCSAVLPSVATCVEVPSAAGCSAVLPTFASCVSTPSLAGCSAVLPSVATCTADPSAAGCGSVLPSLASCSTAPTTPGCSVVLPTLASCTKDSTQTGCTAVLSLTLKNTETTTTTTNNNLAALEGAKNLGNDAGNSNSPPTLPGGSGGTGGGSGLALLDSGAMSLDFGGDSGGGTGGTGGGFGGGLGGDLGGSLSGAGGAGGGLGGGSGNSGGTGAGSGGGQTGTGGSGAGDAGNGAAGEGGTTGTSGKKRAAKSSSGEVRAAAAKRTQKLPQCKT